MGDFETKTYCKYILVPKESHVHDQKLDYQQEFGQGTHLVLVAGEERRPHVGPFVESPGHFSGQQSNF